MSDPFASALDAIFHAPGSEAAEHISIHGLITRELRVIRFKGDREVRFGGGQMIATDCRVDIRRSQLPTLNEGDRLFIGAMVDDEFVPSEELELTGEPMSDVEGMTWTMGYEAVDVSR